VNLNDVKSISERMVEAKVKAEPFDRGQQTGYVEEWLNWTRSQLNNAELDFMENWSKGVGDCVLAEFFVMNIHRTKIGAKVMIIFDPVIKMMRIKLCKYAFEKGESNVLDIGNLPIKAEEWNADQASGMEKFMRVMTDLVNSKT
jgi:hypothetical protein